MKIFRSYAKSQPSPGLTGRSGFTLIEMLAVIAILGILAALAVPALKNVGKSEAQISASRQLLDAVGRARQLAINQRTTVYMVFVSTNYFLPIIGNAWWNNGATFTEQTEVTNLVDRQLSGYSFVAYGRLGDQPGQHAWHYLTTWQSLPDGNYIDPNKFQPFNSLIIPQWQTDFANYGGRPAITNFSWLGYYNTAPLVPFPDDAATNNLISMPFLAFDYTGRLISEVDANGNYHDAYIPLAQGSVAYGYNGATKTLQPTAVDPNNITETPPGNSTNISYNIIHIDAMTGRATLEYFKLQ